jgi:hypothetical protein
VFEAWFFGHCPVDDADELKIHTAFLHSTLET